MASKIFKIRNKYFFLTTVLNFLQSYGGVTRLQKKFGQGFPTNIFLIKIKVFNYSILMELVNFKHNRRFKTYLRLMNKTFLCSYVK